MGDNSLPNNNKSLITLGGDMVAGLTKLGTPLKITQLTPAELSAALNGFIVSEGAYTSLRGLRNGIYATFHSAESNMNDWLNAVRNVLRTHFGAQYSNEWLLAGFTNNTTQLPTTIADRLALCQLVTQFLTNHADFQVDKLDVTPEKGLEVYTAANTAYTAVGNNDVALKQKDNERTTAREWLVGQMTTLICVLRGTLSKDDPRWLDFGLQIPAVPSTPGAPRNLRVSRTDSGNIALDCDATPLGKTFRWRMRLAGSKDSYILVGSTSDPTLVIADPASMADLEFVVQAVNGNRQSVMSDPAVLAPLLAKKISSVESADILPVMTNGSGNRSSNGNGVHSR